MFLFHMYQRDNNEREVRVFSVILYTWGDIILPECHKHSRSEYLVTRVNPRYITILIGFIYNQRHRKSDTVMDPSVKVFTRRTHLRR